MGEFEFASARLTEAQQSAIATLRAAEAEGNDEAIRSVKHWISSWDRALGRDDTVRLAERIASASRRWAGYIFEEGAGI